MNKLLTGILILFLLAPAILAAENEDPSIFGLEIEELLSFMNSIIALTLFIITFIAYRRDGRKRIFYVCLAFLIFAIKSFIDSLELFGLDIEVLGSIAVVLEFLVLLIFFFGVLKKEA